eukprot:m.41325 g.41325  ORF g.41325 m.41325 type:complete len:80 (-) comp14913_c0_seq5:649-888(-)
MCCTLQALAMWAATNENIPFVTESPINRQLGLSVAGASGRPPSQHVVWDIDALFRHPGSPKDPGAHDFATHALHIVAFE